jgi:23S rRNA pseudouridine2457 synthase
MPQYFVLYKPFGIQSQFSDASSLKEVGNFPPEVYPVGRLDKDSEGLLLITDDKPLNHYLLNPRFGHNRTYLVQVEGIPTEEALRTLETGVDIKVKGKAYRTKKASVSLQVNVPQVPERDPPIRYRKSIPDSWISLSLREGKNRQVRKMTASVGFPTLRLIRWSMENLSIKGYAVGEIRKFSKEEIYALLEIDKKVFMKLSDGEPRKSFKSQGNKNRR